jgi:tRNA dimethylallyltransferase
MQSSVTNAEITLNMDNYLISIVGPTGIGKTNLSLKLAYYFNSEIISSDSRQFYKEIPIGTAAPTLVELKSAKHHFIHHVSIKDNYNVGAFQKDANIQIEKSLSSNPVVIMVGGSGLYVDAVINGIDEFPKIDPEIRHLLNSQLETTGIDKLQIELKKLDPKIYNSIDLKNPQRVIRALEICIGTNKPYSSFLKRKKYKTNFKTISIGLKAERQLIYDRINDRVDKMIENGLLDEARSVFKYRDLNSLNTVGYKELFNYFDGKWTLEYAVSEIKKNSRRYAKRQITWFNKDKKTKWFEHDTSFKDITSYLDEELKKPID